MSRLLRGIVVKVALVAGLLVWPFAMQTIDLDAMPAPSARDGVLRLIRSVRTAQAIYRSVHGYYDRLECLSQDSCVPNPYPPTYLLPQDIRRSAYGYRLRLLDGPRVRAKADELVSPTAMSAFAFTAVPVDSTLPGQPSFCADAEGIFEYADGHIPAVTDGRCVDSGALVGDR